MIIICPGGWTDRVVHAPVKIGAHPPEDDARVSHGCCDACVRAMGATITCRLCRKIETRTGLCDRCELSLATHVGEPAYRLTFYRQDSERVGSYDGAGALERLRLAMAHPDYRGFRLDPLHAEVA